jgi:hypothetical protein
MSIAPLSDLKRALATQRVPSRATAAGEGDEFAAVMASFLPGSPAPQPNAGDLVLAGEEDAPLGVGSAVPSAAGPGTSSALQYPPDACKTCTCQQIDTQSGQVSFAAVKPCLAQALDSLIQQG